VKPTRDRELLRLPGTGSDAAERALIDGIAAEFARSFDALADIGPAVAIFGSARIREGHPDYELARSAAEHVGRAGYAVITGGGPGLMEAANRGARDADALSIGVNIELPEEERPNDYLDISLAVRHYFVRKVILFRFACAYVICPGGTGTLDEMFEALALVGVGTIENFPMVLLDAAEWEDLLRWLHARPLAQGRIDPATLERISVVDDPALIPAIVDEGLAAQRAAASG